MGDHHYKPLHAELFSYDDAFVERFIGEGVRRVHQLTPEQINELPCIKEVAEQIYFFQLFTEEFCRLLVEEAEHCGKWVTNKEKTNEPHPFVEGLIDVCEPDTVIEFDELPGLEEVYGSVIKNHVQPIMEAKWVTFKLQKWDMPAVRKYEPDVVNSMDLHYDLETLSMVGYLSKDFVGGGTYFPRWKLLVGGHEDVVPGSVVLYPGGISHEHKALPITAGKRYMLSNSFLLKFNSFFLLNLYKMLCLSRGAHRIRERPPCGQEHDPSSHPSGRSFHAVAPSGLDLGLVPPAGPGARPDGRHRQ
ncbi:Procollagen-lysine,2-oxoglutarate 5-dioxygenase 1 [Balamuthia mandrillaris]